MQQKSISIQVNVAADASDTLYATWPFKGRWRIDKVYFSPATAVSVGATDYADVTITTNDGAAGSDRALASHTTNTGGTALVLKTTVDLTLSAAGRELQQGYQVKIAVDGTPGSGDAIKGTYTVMATKIG